MSDQQSNFNLNIGGAEPSLDSSCPLRDPNAAIQIGDDLISIYQSRIDALINQLGKNIILQFKPSRTICPNCLPDLIKNKSSGRYRTGGPIPFGDGQRCPYCKAIGFLETPVTRCIKCLIKWRPRDAINYGISLSDVQDVVRFKTFFTEADDMIRAESAISDEQVSNVLPLHVKLIRGPIPVGLRDQRYCISFWQLVREN